MLEGRGVKHDVGLELTHEPQDALAIANIRDPTFDHRVGPPGSQSLDDGVECGLRVFDHQQSGRAECGDALANLRTDRAASPGNDNRLAFHQSFKARVVDVFAGAE